MKKTLKYAITLVIAAVMCLSVLPSVALASTPSTDEMNQYMWDAIHAGLVPDELRHSPSNAIRRAEFAALAVALYETAMGREITGRATFSDTNDVNVEKLAYLGVVSGNGDGTFSPNGLVSREQAAVMLARLAHAMGINLPARAPDFNDSRTISPWAVGAVGQMQAARLMYPLFANNFAPTAVISRQQSIVAMLWIHDITLFGTRRVSVELIGYNITNQRLAEMVSSGEIPANVTHLNLAANEISDISPLVNLTNLAELNLWGNNVSNLTPLAQKSRLTRLDISSNNFISIAPLRGLTNLTWLSFGGSHNFDGDVSHIGGLTNLIGLSMGWFWNEEIANYDIIGNLINLESLELWGVSQNTNLSFLNNLANLTDLSLFGAHTETNLSPIRHLYNLEQLSLQTMDIRNLSYIRLDNLTNLRFLALWNNNISDISVLRNLNHLTSLHLSNNRISDVSPLSGLTNLHSLSLSNNLIFNIHPLGSLTNLDWLDLAGNPVCIYQLADLPNALPSTHIHY